MSHCKKQISEFQLEGKFLGFIFKDGYKLKKLRLETATGEYWIKIPKPLREELNGRLQPGDWLQVVGESQLEHKTGKLKLKADRVETAMQSTVPAVHPPEKVVSCQKKASILVCQKSDCWKRGGKEICQTLETQLRDRGLEDQVTIKPTGCLKRCKAGPNVVVMPDKSRYSHITPAEIPSLIEKHFVQENVEEKVNPEILVI